MTCNALEGLGLVGGVVWRVRFCYGASLTSTHSRALCLRASPSYLLLGTPGPPPRQPGPSPQAYKAASPPRPADLPAHHAGAQEHSCAPARLEPRVPAGPRAPPAPRCHPVFSILSISSRGGVLGHSCAPARHQHECFLATSITVISLFKSLRALALKSVRCSSEEYTSSPVSEPWRARSRGSR